VHPGGGRDHQVGRPAARGTAGRLDGGGYAPKHAGGV
jgi:hypothetical protein